MKKIIAKILFLFAGAMLFAQSAEYTAFLTKAKQFETQKKWCHALEAYYDALGTDDEPALKDEAYKGFTELRDAILKGNPGFGTYDVFTLHDEWKKLLIDAEQVGSSFSRYEITLGELKKGDLDYATRTASYSAKISWENSYRYENTIGIVEKGYEKAYKGDWSDLSGWPNHSVSYKKDENYNVAGALIYRGPGSWGLLYAYGNAFAYDRFDVDDRFDYRFNIVDENGKELVKEVRWLLNYQNRSVIFKGVSPAVMALIDNGKAFINPVACYLKYGKYLENSVQLPMEKSVFICWNNKSDREKNNIDERIYRYIPRVLHLEKLTVDSISKNCVVLPGKNCKMLNTEVTQRLYDAVTGENPSNFEGDDLPVENVSWYDAIYFCNELSRLKNLEPVYSVNGETDVTRWNYILHNGESIRGEIIQNTAANGFRLPTLEEWLYAVKGGENYKYAGNDNLGEVGWYEENSGDETHPVAKKKANGYGLCDMIGNVWEWVWDSGQDGYRYVCGGGYDENATRCEATHGYHCNPYYRNSTNGFRIVCTASSL